MPNSRAALRKRNKIHSLRFTNVHFFELEKSEINGWPIERVEDEQSNRR